MKFQYVKEYESIRKILFTEGKVPAPVRVHTLLLITFKDVPLATSKPKINGVSFGFQYPLHVDVNVQNDHIHKTNLTTASVEAYRNIN